MNIVPLKPYKKKLLKEADALFSRMENSLKIAQVDPDKSIRIAKILAPILSDQSSNNKHVKTINSNSTMQEKVIAVLMLGFPKNREMLPTLQNVLHSGPEALRIASAIAISQMRDGKNNELLGDVLFSAYEKESSTPVKKAVRQALLVLMDKKMAARVKSLSE